VASKNQKKSDGKYAPRASARVAEEMRELKRGTLRAGRSKKKVTNPKQAIAIGLSKARREGAQVPPPPRGQKTKKGRKRSARPHESQAA